MCALLSSEIIPIEKSRKNLLDWGGNEKCRPLLRLRFATFFGMNLWNRTPREFWASYFLLNVTYSSYSSCSFLLAECLTPAVHIFRERLYREKVRMWKTQKTDFFTLFLTSSREKTRILTFSREKYFFWFFHVKKFEKQTFLREKVRISALKDIEQIMSHIWWHMVLNDQWIIAHCVRVQMCDVVCPIFLHTTMFGHCVCCWGSIQQLNLPQQSVLLFCVP